MYSKTTNGIKVTVTPYFLEDQAFNTFNVQCTLLWTFINSNIRQQHSPSGGMVDAGDSKSPDGNIVRVRVSPWAPLSH